MRRTVCLDKYGTMDPDLLACLEESKKMAEGEELRLIKCPQCGFILMKVIGRNHVIVKVKCQKCKFCEVMDIALFRTVKRRGYRPMIRYSTRPRMIR